MVMSLLPPLPSPSPPPCFSHLLCHVNDEVCLPLVSVSKGCSSPLYVLESGRSPGSNPACAGIFSGSSHTSDFKIGTPVAIPCQAPGVIGSALGLVGPVSVYRDWVRWKVWSATSISVWQHVKLSEQIRP